MSLYQNSNFILTAEFLTAVQEKNYDRVQALLQHDGVDVNAVNEHGVTALMLAALRADMDMLAHLIKCDRVDVNAKMGAGTAMEGGTALMLAAQQGHKNAVDLLKSCPGLKINAANAAGHTALMIAVVNKHLNVVESLIDDEGLDINAQDALGGTALTYAVFAELDRTIEILQTRKDLDSTALDKGGNTALMHAILKGYPSIVKVLLESATPEQVDTPSFITGRTALMLAAGIGDDSMVDSLLKAGAKIDAVDHMGHTPLMWTVLYSQHFLVDSLSDFGPNGRISATGHLKVINLLLDGATPEQINTPNKKGLTALMLAATHEDERIVDSLLKAGADINAVDHLGQTALLLAARYGKHNAVDLLTEAEGINVNAAANDGFTPLMNAALNGHPDIVARLIAKGADITVSGKEGHTALMLATIMGHLKVIDILLADASPELINATDKLGWTALMFAAEAGNKPLMAKLIEKGADSNITNNAGETAQTIASKIESENALKISNANDHSDAGQADLPQDENEHSDEFLSKFTTEQLPDPFSPAPENDFVAVELIAPIIAGA